MTRFPLVAKERLGYVKDMLRASGWTEDGDAWLAPEDFRDALALSVGRGAVSLSLAVRAMVIVDEETVSIAARAA